MLGGSDDEFLVDEFSDDDYQNLKPEEKEKILEYLCYTAIINLKK